MAAYGQSFESANSIDARKEFKRKAREQVLLEAKEKYEREEKRKELKRARGEDTWMLPEVNQRLQQLEQEHSGKKKKKEKKSKKIEDQGDEWVEAPPPPDVAQKAGKIQEENSPTDSATSASKRDEWMTFDFLTMKTTSAGERRAEKEKQKEAEREKARSIEQAGLHRLELNPYWKDGGTGLPSEESSVASAKKSESLVQPAVLFAVPVFCEAAVVDDGGLSWLRKAHQRMREQAEREQRSLEAVVAERYGSMEEFHKRLEEAENAAFGQRKEERGAGAERWRRKDPLPSERRFGRGRDGSSPERGRDSVRGSRRDWHMDRGRDSRDRRGDDGLRDGRSNDSERENAGDHRESPSRRRRHDDSPHRQSSPRRRRHDDSPRRQSSPRRQRHDDSPSRASPPRGRRDDASPGRENLPTGRRRNETPRGESPVRRQSRDRSPPSLGSLKAKFLKPATGEDDAWTNWGGRKEATPASGSSGFLRPSVEKGQTTFSRTPAWKKPSFRKPESEGGPSSSVAPDQALRPALKDCRGDGASPPEQPSREANVARQENLSVRPVATPPRSSPVPAHASGSEESEEEEEDVPVLTDEEMNKLGAKLVKAELLGNTALVDKLKAQLESARKAKESRAQRGQAAAVKASGHTEADQDVVLFRTDQAGRAWPVNAPSEPREPSGGRRKKAAIETHQGRERVRYFADDDGLNLQEMVRRERMSTSEDQNALYSRMAAKMMGKQDGDNYTLDDMFVSSAAQRERSGQDEERQRSRAIQEHRRLAARMEKCPYCFDSAELPKHLVIAIGTKVYLCLPNSVSMAEGHCLIAPLQHHCAATGLDEDVWAEIQMFRKALVKMFEDQEQDCVFLETHMNPKSRRHMVYECIPLPRELGDMAPIYFKKALLESDEEWAMNKKVVDLSSKDIRHSVPKGLPYFAVDFGLQGGFAHVIENEEKFPHYFGKEIIGGMLDLEPRRWRKPIRENFDDQRKKVLEFAKWWKPFDCTKTGS
ncbi:hypothetical protein GJAV_G00054610 [Gymnothorax javanicus]|nr:hypothetical protein GJAV_G00054610 [Gymnothorax javanicus]